jgi:cytochrome bd ubiquinol oxidase subunit II
VDWLPVLLGFAVVFSVVMYVVMDGFDLGIGILLPLAPSEDDRIAMINAIAPFWDGNETWLVLGGTFLIAAFPLAYATLLPAFYVPLLTMLFALVFRGVAFEFRFRADRFRPVWDAAFSGGSLLATFCQGVVLGAFIAGIPVADRTFQGGTLDFISAFAVICGLGLIAGYALLGATWLVFKTNGTTAAYGRIAARLALPATLAFIVLVSMWTPIAFPHVAQRWFAWPNIGYLSPVPIVTVLVAYGTWRAIPGPSDRRPFLLGVALFCSHFSVSVSACGPTRCLTPRPCGRPPRLPRRWPLSASAPRSSCPSCSAISPLPTGSSAARLAPRAATAVDRFRRVSADAIGLPTWRELPQSCRTMANGRGAHKRTQTGHSTFLLRKLTVSPADRRSAFQRLAAVNSRGRWLVAHKCGTYDCRRPPEG